MGERARIQPIEARSTRCATRNETVAFEGLKSLLYAREI